MQATTAASNIEFIVAAYAVTWIVVLGYLTRLIVRGARARADYERIVQKGNGGTVT